MVFEKFDILSKENRKLILEETSNIIKDQSQRIGKKLTSSYHFLKRKTSAIIMSGVVVYSGLVTSALLESNEQKSHYRDIAWSWVDLAEERAKQINELSFEKYNLEKENNDMSKTGELLFYQMQAEQFKSEGLQEIINHQSKELAYKNKQIEKQSITLNNYLESYYSYRNAYAFNYVTQSTLEADSIRFDIDEYKLPHSDNSYGLMSIIAFADKNELLVDQISIDLKDKWLFIEVTNGTAQYQIKITRDSLKSESCFTYKEGQIQLDFIDTNLDGNLNSVLTHHKNPFTGKINSLIYHPEHLVANKEFYDISMTRYGIELKNMFMALQQ